MTGLDQHLTLPCGVRLKNRFAKAAMTEGLADPSNRATDRHATLYRRWAEGGAGLLLTGNVMVDRRYLERPGNVVIDGDQSPDRMSALAASANAAHEGGAAVWMQLSHAGRQSPKIVAAEPVGPSAVQVKLPGGQFGAPRALSGGEAEDVVARFANAASVAKEAGFDGVQVHAAHGYLISEFLNPLVNLRTDEWGGSLENRARLLTRTVEAVRAKVGSGFPVSVKLNSSDFQRGGFGFEDCLKVVAMLDDRGVDLIEISGGNYEQPRMMGIEGLEPVFEEAVRASTRAREAYFIQYAEEVARIARAPLMVTGGFRTRAAMDEALSSGAAAVIGVARPLCVEPDLPKRLLAGKIDALPAFEKSLRIGPGVLGPNSPVAMVKAINGFASMAFYYQNIYRLADGKEALASMPLLPAFLRHQSQEAATARGLANRQPVGG
ncbi:MAG: NADH:flavin oxidoreductase [Alphaproteobacteria bacterium]|nr:NADH:flavin oxidoreductase [Alphaproteobacteria bacterium]